MTNRFYNETYTGAIGQSVSAKSLDTQFVGLTAGIDLIQAELDRLAANSTITALSGFPASFSGQAGKYPVVNAAESAIEFVSGGRLTIKVISATSYTLLATDAGKLLVFTNASAITVTVPPSVLTQGDVVCIRQGAAGQVTLSAGSGVTFASSDNLLSTRTQSAQIALIADGGNAFGVIGERNAPSLGVALLAQANVFTKAQTVTPVALTDAATIATDASLSNNFTVTLGGNRALGNPTGLTNGVILNWKIKQDATGSRTLTSYGSMFKWAGGTAPVLSTAANARDFITAQYFSDENILIAAIMKGVA